MAYIAGKLSAMNLSKEQVLSLRALLHDQLEHIQQVINRIMYDRKDIGDEAYYSEIEKWVERETTTRHEISELEKFFKK